MNCMNCGQPLAEGVKFCANCGTRVEQQCGAFCSTCGAKLEPSALFCTECGVKVGQAAKPIPSGKLIASLKMVSMYEGTPAVGLAKATGSLSVYDDRIEFIKQLGSALGGAFGAVGMALAKNKIKDDPIDIYPVSQISGLCVGQYCRIYNTLMVTLRDGTTTSFCPALPNSSVPQNIIDGLQPYLR